MAIKQPVVKTNLHRAEADDICFFGRADGRDAIRKMLEESLAEELHFSRYLVLMPLIEIDGDEATGKWYLDYPFILGGDDAVWKQ
jgi:hypothetical protein